MCCVYVVCVPEYLCSQRVVLSCLTWILEPELRSSARAGLSSPTPVHMLITALVLDDEAGDDRYQGRT